jgi:Peptidase family S41
VRIFTPEAKEPINQYMKFLGRIIWGAGILAFLAGSVRAEVTNTPPDFNEVYNLLKEHLAGQTPADLDRAAVQGLISELHSRVSLVSGNEGANASSQSEGPKLAKSALYDGPIAYFKIGRVGEGLANQINTAYKELNGTNKLKGVVLDLRFADGRDYDEAVSVANLFVSKEQPLLDLGSGAIKSKANPDAISLPVAVLVNQKTSAAAEALAAVLRSADRAMIIGTNTAGEASIDKTYPLKNGQSLRIATAEIKLGNGNSLPARGITPDIPVAVSPEDERAYAADPFKEIVKPSNLLASAGNSGTNGTATTNRTYRRLNEAELMRERKEGLRDLDSGLPSSNPAPLADTEKPVVRDPVLGRALDLIKGIAALKQFRTS